MAGHGVRAASEAVDLEAGGNSLGSRVLDARAKTRTGGDLIPEETDPWDPAPRALAPEEPESRDARRTVVRGPPRRRCPRRMSAAYRPACIMGRIPLRSNEPPPPLPRRLPRRIPKCRGLRLPRPG